MVSLLTQEVEHVAQKRKRKRCMLKRVVCRDLETVTLSLHDSTHGIHLLQE